MEEIKNMVKVLYAKSSFNTKPAKTERQCFKITINSWTLHGDYSSHTMYTVYVMLPFKTPTLVNYGFSGNPEDQERYPFILIEPSSMMGETLDIDIPAVIRTMDDMKPNGYTSRSEGLPVAHKCIFVDTEGNIVEEKDPRWEWRKWEFRIWLPVYKANGIEKIDRIKW